MSIILRISDAASIGLHAMAFMALADKGTTLSAVKIAQSIEVSEAHLSKVLQRLGRSGMVISKRGPGGGFVLGREPGEITLGEIYEAIEGPFPEGVCLLGCSECVLEECMLGSLLTEIQSQVSRRFAGTTLEDLRGRRIESVLKVDST